MKVGTDGVLLGAWVSLDPDPRSILDIGAGTGLIALQLAQRSIAETIDAIEIDTDAYEQCVENFENAPWADRLFCYHASLQEFAMELEDESYDLIVSNPPFYTDDYKPNDSARNTARFTDTLPFEHLIGAVHQLLSEDGIFATILPIKEKNHFISLASDAGLYPKRICTVKGSITSEEKRVLLEFSFTEMPPEHESLTLELARHEYTEAYLNLVRDFYLKL